MPADIPAPTAWHARPVADIVRDLEIDPADGLTAAEAEQRLQRNGRNQLADAPRQPRWRAFLRQFQNLLIIILLVAAVVALVVSREWETPIAIAVVVLLNATIGFVQESKAEASLDALRRMSVTNATVRRDGRIVRLDAAELVPGDVIVVEAGDRIPADGRLLSGTSLEIQESMLTGEAQPSAKSASAEIDENAALGDRANTVYMNTAVTRGHGEVLVTATGMQTETGRIAEMLHHAKPGSTPLQQQIDALSRTLAFIAGGVIVVVFALGLIRGQQFDDLFISAVSLAVAAIPEGLPAVVAFTLAMGAGRLAKRGAIVKRLAAVETLGSTTQICTDKTGTLTLNQMTARELQVAGRRFTISGEGYATDGKIEAADGASPGLLGEALVPMALCSDAVLRDGDIVGDPTEGALVVLAEKGGIDAAALRKQHPRVLDIPFDSDYKYMATFHDWTDEQGRKVVRCFVKGAPDVLATRADRHLGEAAKIMPFDAAAQQRHHQANGDMAEQGMRVMAVGMQDFPAGDFEPAQDPKAMLDRLVLVALIGIVDPPRPEARQSIQECRDAGIRVRMLTGDHVVTAAAVAAEIGIPGRAVTGGDLDTITDDEDLASELDNVGVVARVSPSHKIRIVSALQQRGDVVAMTGDGVNDAPALRKADIGVAMGKTGTEVTKEAATMVLTDDNFATIVSAVREGRGVYANIVNFTRFQVSTALGFVITFLIASLTGIAGGAPFTALQILFVNLVMDGPPAMSLGVDPVSSDAMNQPPRRRNERILNHQRLLRVLLASAVMAGGTLAVLVWAPGPAPRLGQATVAGTMAFVTFVLFQAFNLLNVRSDIRSVFSRETLHNRSAFAATGLVVAVLALIVQTNVAHNLFATTDLTPRQWLACTAVASTILITGELLKAVLRSHRRRAQRRNGSPERRRHTAV
ncbi:cation-translocating P-type ATPase [Actinoplanes sp. GCM10030250]|uniref:cation-translocating P-type ATPase n=1 Tax=Actinoplanes sp. GCM10030250 TaxID=3273376 RepID=UPI00362299A5